MNPIARWFTAALASTSVLFCGWNGIAVPISSSDTTRHGSCMGPEYREFDFWIADWDVFDTGSPNTTVARVRVDRVLDGCVLQEQYEDPSGMKGRSLSIYDASRKVWHQSWFTNHGQLLGIEGAFQAGEMVLSGMDRTPSGEERHVRGTGRPVDGGVREKAVTSTDGGKTWKPWFDLMFRLAADSGASPHPSPADDEKAVAALDTEYQAAVKRNDAAAMERLLADDFILVTGSGKTYNKADLLKEALSGRVTYEHQADIQQTVRVWGDTAVVTAKLWAKGTESGTPFEYALWFSDTYVRTPTGWRYVFGQASLRLPNTPQ